MSKKRGCVCCAQLLSPARLLCPWGFSAQEYWSGLPCPPPGDLPNPGIEPSSPEQQVDSLPSEPPGNTGVSSLSLFQWIFLTQELNQCLLHCRWILYQLSYWGATDSLSATVFKLTCIYIYIHTYIHTYIKEKQPCQEAINYLIKKGRHSVGRDFQKHLRADISQTTGTNIRKIIGRKFLETLNSQSKNTEKECWLSLQYDTFILLQQEK